MSSSSFVCSASPSRFCVFWMRNTIRKVAMVVPVLMTSCQASEKWNRGPVAAQRITMARHVANAWALPANRAVRLASSEKRSSSLTEGYPADRREQLFRDQRLLYDPDTRRRSGGAKRGLRMGCDQQGGSIDK